VQVKDFLGFEILKTFIESSPTMSKLLPLEHYLHNSMHQPHRVKKQSNGGGSNFAAVSRVFAAALSSSFTANNPRVKKIHNFVTLKG